MSEKTFEDLKPIFRPPGIHPGIMKIIHEKCTKCGLCVQNCPMACFEWEKDSDDFPKMKEGNVGCFSCFNCMVACPVDAVEIVETWRVEGGPFDQGWPMQKPPLEPRDAEGNLSEWNVVERTVLERRSVRNFKAEPVSAHLIRRVLEAGRFGPSAGNNQNWKFAVVTDKAFLNELEQAAFTLWSAVHAQYHDDAQVVGLWQAFGGELMPPGAVEPRGIIRGVDCLVDKQLASFLNAPCVIFVGGNNNMFSPDVQVGIAGQNMNIVAHSLGLGMCWSGFGSIAIDLNPEMKKKLGFDGDWRIIAALCMGYPKFKQKGLVKRHYRPVTWFRQGGAGPEVEYKGA
ncbi:MAG: nitroreductase family protein [Syntrophobacteraceae bacterium]|jgi:nitroreductase/ferredoxin